MKEKFVLNSPSTSSSASSKAQSSQSPPPSAKANAAKSGEDHKEHSRLHPENIALNAVLSIIDNASSSSRSPSINSASYFQMLKCVTVEENDGIRKSGIVTVYFQTTKHKKTYFAVLTERTFELHESEKTQRKNKSAKYIVDLSTCFNISQQHYSKFRNFVSLMTPDETLLFKGEKEPDSERWYSKILEAVIPARAIHLGRPVFATEFFESAWDVILKANPRLKNSKPDPANLPNICTRRPELAEQKRRLCIYPHAIILCEFGIGPSLKGAPNSSIPPFKTSNFIEFSRAYVKDFGSHDKYFFLRFGRSSEIGACEVWMQCTAPACEPEESATEIYTKIKNVIDRENEKQRKGMDAAFPALGCNNSLSIPSSSARRHNTRKSTKSGGSASTRNCANAKGALPASSSSFEHPSCDIATSSSSFSPYHDNDKSLLGYPRSVQSHEKQGTNDDIQGNVGKGNAYRASNRCYCRELASSSLILEPSGTGVDDETEDSGGTLRVSCENCENCRADSPPVDHEKYDNDGEDTASYGSSSHRNATMSADDLSEVESPKHAAKIEEKYECFLEKGTRTSIDELKYMEQRNENRRSSTVRTREENLRKSVSLCLEGECRIAQDSEVDTIGRKPSSSMLCLSDQLPENFPNTNDPTTVASTITTSSASSSSSSYRVEMMNPAPESSGECSSENMSTSSSISTGGHLSSSFSTDASTSSVHLYTGAGLHSQPPPYHPRTMSCSAGTYGVRTGPSSGGRITAADASLAETAARSAFYKMQQKKRRPIVEESAISSSGDNAESSLGSIVDQASCSSAGSVPFLSVPRHYENEMIASSCVDETCSYASDSADSCYSSINNGNLDPRTFSFSSDIPRPFINHSGYATVAENEVTHHYNNKSHSDQPNPTHQDHEVDNPSHQLPPKQSANVSPRGRSFRNSSTRASSAQLGPAEEEIQLLESTIISGGDTGSSKSNHTSPKSNISSHSVVPTQTSHTDDSRRRTFSLGNTSWLAKKLLPRKLSSNANRIAKTSKSDRAIRSSKDEVELQMRPMLGDVAFPAWSYGSSSIKPSTTSLHFAPPSHSTRSEGGRRDDNRRLSWRSTDDHNHQFAMNQTSRDTISPSPSLTASSSSIVRANSSSSQRTGLSGGRGSFCVTPSASLAGFSIASDNFNSKYSTDDYAEDPDFTKNTAYRPEKSRMIVQKLHTVQCYTSAEDHAILDALYKNSINTNNNSNNSKSSDDLKSKGGKTKSTMKTKRNAMEDGDMRRGGANMAGLNVTTSVNNIVRAPFETINENVSGRNSPLINNNDSKSAVPAVSKTQEQLPSETTKISNSVVKNVPTTITTTTSNTVKMETVEPEENVYVPILCPSSDNKMNAKSASANKLNILP